MAIWNKPSGFTGFTDAFKYIPQTPAQVTSLHNATALGKLAAVAAMTGIGAATVRGYGGSGGSNLSAGTSRHERITYEDINSRGFWNKQKTLMGISLMSQQPQAYFKYAAGEVAATFTGPYSRDAMGAGAVIGGVGAGIFTAFSKSAKSRLGAVAAAAGAGAVMGGLTARKVQLAVAESFNTVKKNLYKKPMFSNKARTVGPGYRSWAQRRTMGKPGHLGVTGSLPFAMHQARHKSTV
jgi:hypothetical protein